MIFHISCTAGSIKLVDSSKWKQEWIHYGCLRYMYTPQTRGSVRKCFFVFCLELMWWTFKSFISRELYIIKLADLSKLRKTYLSISVYYNIRAAHFVISFSTNSFNLGKYTFRRKQGRQKGESQNGFFKKTKHAKFPEKRTFLAPWYELVCMRIRD